MSARWAPHWQLLSASWRMSGRWSAFRILTVGLLVVSVVGMACSTPLVQAPKVREAFAVFAIVALGVLWTLHSTTLIRFNHPVDARLVPRQLRCMREAILGMWLTFLVCATLLAIPAGLSFGDDILRLLFVASGSLLALLMTRWPLLGAWLPLFLIHTQLRETHAFFIAIANVVHELGQPVRLTPPSLASLVVLTILLSLARLLTHGVLRNGGEAHAKRYYLNPLASGKPQARSGTWLSGDWMVGLRQLNRRQRAALLQSKSPSESVLQRVVGMRLDAGAEWWRLLLVYAFVVLVVCSGLWFENELIATLALGGACIGAVAMPLIARSARMAQSAKEHALWMLLPGMPRGVALNRALATRFLKDSLVTWAGVAVLSIAPSFFPPTTDPWDGTGLALVVIGLLPSVVFAINDWSRMRLTLTALPGGALWCVASPLMCIAAFAIGAPVWLLALCSVLATVVALGWRWRRLEHYPAALPAGRLQ